MKEDIFIAMKNKEHIYDADCFFPYADDVAIW